MNFRAERQAEAHTAACKGKVTFRSFGEAERAAHKSARLRKARLVPYPCLVCHHFHVGNSLQRTPSNGHGLDPRHRYIVFGTKGDGREVLVGYSKEPDGGVVARRVTETVGWLVSRIVDRKPYLKDAA